MSLLNKALLLLVRDDYQTEEIKNLRNRILKAKEKLQMGTNDELE